MKKLIALLLVFATLFALSACGGEGAKETQNAKTEEKKTEVAPKDTAPEVPAVPQIPTGKIEGSTYTAADGLSLTLPENWSFAAEADIPTISGRNYDAMANDSVNGSTLEVYYILTSLTPAQQLAKEVQAIKGTSGKQLEILRNEETVKISDKDFVSSIFYVDAAGLSWVEHFFIRSAGEGLLQVLKISINSSYEESPVVEMFGIKA